eukprot:190529-Chlamydomonas_euryale.AAC.6
MGGGLLLSGRQSPAGFWATACCVMCGRLLAVWMESTAVWAAAVTFCLPVYCFLPDGAAAACAA